MQFVKLIQSLEDALFEFCLWLALWPKTFYRILVRPAWIHSFVDEQATKESGEQYNAYMPPALFLAISVLLWGGVFEVGDPKLLADIVKQVPGFNVGEKGPGFEHKLILLIAIAMLWPVVLGLTSTIVEKLELTRSTIRASFNKHAFVTATFWGMLLLFIMIVGFGSELFSWSEDSFGLFLLFAFVAACAWFYWADSRVFADELNSTRWRGFKLALLSTVIWSMIIAVGIAAIDAGGKEASAGESAAPDESLQSSSEPSASLIDNAYAGALIHRA